MARFQQTSWSLVFTAGKSAPEARDALQRLCTTYLPPVLAFIRGRGYPEEDARDLAQEFFTQLLEKEWLRRADPERGRFRTYLLTSVSRFLANQHARATAQKRGGGIVRISIEDAAEMTDSSMRPEQLFDRKWALTLMECALERLRRRHESHGQLQRFDVLKSSLTPAQPGSSLREIAQRLGISEGAAKVACHRLKKAYGGAIREEIMETLPEDGNPDEELRHLMNALSARDSL
jgi:RNA polymerase sigma-70 factor (ECF subfamily)